MTRRPAPEPFVTSSWSQSSPPQVAGDVEAEHHAALHVLGDVAMGHPHAGASGVEQDLGGLAGTDQHDVPRDQVGLGHHVAGQHQEPVGAVQVERGWCMGVHRVDQPGQDRSPGGRPRCDLIG